MTRKVRKREWNNIVQKQLRPPQTGDVNFFYPESITRKNNGSLRESK